MNETYQLSKPLVVKLGGSLFNRVPELVPILQGSERPLLIVPGGGKFADAVRDAGLPSDAAHWMAIRAMDKYGEYISTFGLPATDRFDRIDETTVLLPYRSMNEQDPLPHTWDITSDTIAAWIAGELNLELLLLKSVDGITIEGILTPFITESLPTDVVDPFCIPFILNHGIRATIINGSVGENITRFLRGHPVPSTRIGTTF